MDCAIVTIIMKPDRAYFPFPNPDTRRAHWNEKVSHVKLSKECCTVCQTLSFVHVWNKTAGNYSCQHAARMDRSRSGITSTVRIRRCDLACPGKRGRQSLSFSMSPSALGTIRFYWTIILDKYIESFSWSQLQCVKWQASRFPGRKSLLWWKTKLLWQLDTCSSDMGLKQQQTAKQLPSFQALLLQSYKESKFPGFPIGKEKSTTSREEMVSSNSSSSKVQAQPCFLRAGDGVNQSLKGRYITLPATEYLHI